MILELITKQQKKFYLLGIMLLTVTSFFSVDYIDNRLRGILGILAIALFLCVIFTTKFSNKELILFFLIGITIASVAYFSNRQALFLSFFALVASKNIDSKLIFKFIFFTGLASLVSTIAVYLTVDGFSQAMMEIRQMLGITFYVSKNTLGYPHANMLYLLIFILISLYIYLNFNTMKILPFILLMTISGVAFAVTFSRTGIAVFIFSMLLYLILRWNKLDYDLVYRILKYIPFLILILSFILPFLYTMYPEGIMHVLNRSLSDRLYYSAEFLRVANRGMIGTDVAGLVGGEIGFPLRADNSFILIIRAYGYVIFSLVVFLTMNITRQKFTKEDIFIILIMYLYCFTEGFFVIAVQNISLFILVKKYFEHDTKNRTIYEIFLGRIHRGTKSTDF